MKTYVQSAIASIGWYAIPICKNMIQKGHFMELFLFNCHHEMLGPEE